MSRKRRSHGKSVATLVALAFLGLGTAWAGDLGSCATASVPRSIVLPDGSVQPPGALRLCLRSESPVSGTYELAVNGMALGQWPSRVGRSEGLPSEQPVAVFEWTRGGDLRLIGYARPDGDHMRTYVFHGYGPLSERVLADAAALLAPEQLDQRVMFLARK